MHGDRQNIYYETRPFHQGERCRHPLPYGDRVLAQMNRSALIGRWALNPIARKNNFLWSSRGSH